MESRRCPTIYVLSRLGASNQAEVPPPLKAPVAFKTSGTDVPFAGLLTPQSPFVLFRRSPSLAQAPLNLLTFDFRMNVFPGLSYQPVFVPLEVFIVHETSPSTLSRRLVAPEIRTINQPG